LRPRGQNTARTNYQKKNQSQFHTADVHCFLLNAIYLFVELETLRSAAFALVATSAIEQSPRALGCPNAFEWPWFLLL
jgi:hypothetical protein